MKSISKLAGVLLACMVLTAEAGPAVTPSLYFTNYVCVAGFTNAGTTGLDTNKNYACFEIGEITDCTPTLASNDVRVVLDGLAQTMYARIQARTETNRPAFFTLTQERGEYTGTLWRVEHNMRFYKAVGTWTFPTE